MTTPPSLPPELRSRVLGMASASPAPPRAVGQRRQAVSLVLGFAVPLLVMLWLRPGLWGRPAAYVVAVAGAWLVLALAATWGGFMRGRSMLGRPALVHVLVAAAVPAALLATALLAGLVWPETQDDQPTTITHLTCIAVTLLAALGPLVAFAAIRRGSDPVAPRLTGAAIGAASGGWGAVVIALLCSHASGLHVLLGHVLPVVLLTLAGVVVGARVLAIRRTD